MNIILNTINTRCHEENPSKAHLKLPQLDDKLLEKITNRKSVGDKFAIRKQGELLAPKGASFQTLSNKC